MTTIACAPLSSAQVRRVGEVGMPVANVVDRSAHTARDGGPEVTTNRRPSDQGDAILHVRDRFDPFGLLLGTVERNFDVVTALRQQPYRRVEVPEIARVVHHEQEAQRAVHALSAASVRSTAVTRGEASPNASPSTSMSLVSRTT